MIGIDVRRELHIMKSKNASGESSMEIVES